MVKRYPAARSAIYFLLITSFLAGLTACQSELSGEGGSTLVPAAGWSNTPVSAPVHPASVLLRSLKKADTVLTIDQGTGGNCNARGIFLNAQPNIFVKNDGSPVTGNVTLTVTTATSFADMIHNGLGTYTSSDLLVTGGMVKIKATQGTEVLRIKAGKKLQVSFPQPYNPQFKGYIGKETGEQENIINWGLNNNWTVEPDSGQTSGITRINVDSCTWINCDRLSNLPGPFTNIYLKLPPNYGNANTNCYIVFTAQRSIAALHGDPVNQRFWQGTYYKVPVGVSVKLIAVSRIDNRIYYGSATAATSDNLTVNIAQMDEVSESELNTRLNSL